MMTQKDYHNAPPKTRERYKKAINLKDILLMMDDRLSKLENTRGCEGKPQDG